MHADVDSVGDDCAVTDAADLLRVQSAGYFLELSPDWIVLRASENIHHLLGESHVTLIDEPLGRFVHAQILHDLRNLFSRLSGATGIARAYRVRLSERPDLVDIAFQLSSGRVLLEAVPSAADGYGEAFGTVGGLIALLSRTSGQSLLDGAARCMRALTGYDRVTLTLGDDGAESSRGNFPAATAEFAIAAGLVSNCDGAPVAIFPRKANDETASRCLMRALDEASLDAMRAEGVRATLNVPITSNGEPIGQFRCASRIPRKPSFELHAAAELFAQMFAMRLEIDRLRSKD